MIQNQSSDPLFQQDALQQPNVRMIQEGPVMGEAGIEKADNELSRVKRNVNAHRCRKGYKMTNRGCRKKKNIH